MNVNMDYTQERITMSERERSRYLGEYERAHQAFYERLAKLPEDDFRARFEMAHEATRNSWRTGTLLSPWTVRDVLRKQYSFAVPCDEALDTLASLGPVVEMGAGSGYWAYLLRKRGVDVQAYDKSPGKKNPYEFTKRWTGVVHGLPGKLKKRADRTLFLSWPDYNTSFASRCLEHYRGDTVVYIGEGWGGCTGDDAFHQMLERDWTEAKEIRIPQWDGLHDSFVVYKRGKEAT